MKQYFILAVFTAFCFCSQAQEVPAIIAKDFSIEKINPSTPVKNQAMTGTCWSFSTTALVESQWIRTNKGTIDLSEIFTVRNIYIEKAKNYISRQGATQFGEGGLGHDVIRAINRYGAVPEEVYSGLTKGNTMHNHSALETELKSYLENLLKSRPVPADWLSGYESILDKHLGKVPSSFSFNNRTYTPLSFAKDVMNFKAGDYVNITSFTHQPYYQAFILDVPDNFSNGAYYNLPLNEMIQAVKAALKAGYTIMWDADVSNNGFRQDKGLALFPDDSRKYAADSFNLGLPEEKWDASIRQQMFENLTTQDDHLMQITGIVKANNGKEFFTVKNSWGEVGPYKGYIEVSEAYFAINTISLVMPKAALEKGLLEKMKLN
jgi:bleomycin hydrolase